MIGSMIGLHGTKKVLDVACGHGRHSIELAKRGFNVTGIDIMEDFIEIARKNARMYNLNITFLKMDIRELPFKEEFDAAILCFSSFGYFNEKENLKILKNINKALKPNGSFLIDVLNRDSRATSLKESVFEVNGDLMIDIPKFDPLEGRVYVKRIMIRGSNRREIEYDMRIYNLTELNRLMETAGFRLKKVFGNWNKEPFTPSSPRIIAVFEKNM